ncbi:nuclear transport factor 2 family protein [Pseudanabaenaceae cyanobacterium LEGE 13415]|nr:nuclear transport factor 2 family protein [Pseudanabaenaceae cyanobacterium LEGE 13415]
MLSIDGISHPTILQYFETLNAGDFEAVSELFAIDGAMQPPFEKPIAGRDAIASYLKQEATGLTALPQAGIVTEQDYQITGRVQMPMFGVNVTWYFIINPDEQLTFLRIKLNASPQELANLRQ